MSNIDISISEINFEYSKTRIIFIAANGLHGSDFLYQSFSIEIELETTVEEITDKLRDEFNKKCGTQYGNIEFNKQFIGYLTNIVNELKFLNTTIKINENNRVVATLEHENNHLINTETKKMSELKQLNIRMEKLCKEIGENADEIAQNKTLINNLAQLMKKDLDFSKAKGMKSVLCLMVKILNDSDDILSGFDLQDWNDVEDMINIGNNFGELKNKLNELNIMNELAQWER